MHETKEKVKKLGDLKEKLFCCLETEVMGKGLAEIATGEMGEVVDMIKDLAEAEEKCWKSCYYRKLIENLDEQKEEREMWEKQGMGPMGYDHYRYSSGRFAPKGKGHYSSGYTPNFMMMEENWEDGRDGLFPDHMMLPMGYSDGRSGSSSNSRGRSGIGQDSQSGSSYGYMPSRYGKSFDEYEMAKRHYTDSKSLKDKSEMDEKAMEHMEDATMALREIWKNADTDLKRQMKPAIEALHKEMSVV